MLLALERTQKLPQRVGTVSKTAATTLQLRPGLGIPHTVTTPPVPGARDTSNKRATVGTESHNYLWLRMHDHVIDTLHHPPHSKFKKNQYYWPLPSEETVKVKIHGERIRLCGASCSGGRIHQLNSTGPVFVAAPCPLLRRHSDYPPIQDRRLRNCRRKEH